MNARRLAEIERLREALENIEALTFFDEVLSPGDLFEVAVQHAKDALEEGNDD